jgi:Cu/Ag efflux pump CusA
MGQPHKQTLERDLTQAIVEGAALRARPIAMTVAVIIAGLLPVMWARARRSCNALLCRWWAA